MFDVISLTLEWLNSESANQWNSSADLDILLILNFHLFDFPDLIQSFSRGFPTVLIIQLFRKDLPLFLRNKLKRKKTREGSHFHRYLCKFSFMSIKKKRNHLVTLEIFIAFFLTWHLETEVMISSKVFTTCMTTCRPSKIFIAFSFFFYAE